MSVKTTTILQVISVVSFIIGTIWISIVFSGMETGTGKPLYGDPRVALPLVVLLASAALWVGSTAYEAKQSEGWSGAIRVVIVFLVIFLSGSIMRSCR